MIKVKINTRRRIRIGKTPSNGIKGIRGPNTITMNPMIMDERKATNNPRRILDIENFNIDFTDVGKFLMFVFLMRNLKILRNGLAHPLKLHLSLQSKIA